MQSCKIGDLEGGGGGSPLPTPGFTVKTRDEVGHKIFLNICSSPLVPLPPLWHQNPPSTPSPFSQSSPTPLGTLITTYLTAPPHCLHGHMDSDSKKKAESALAIPMHLSSPPRSTVDHLGNTCMVLDCVINPVVLEATTQSRPLKMFLVQLALGETEKNLSRQVDPQFKLPKMRTKGELAPLETSLLNQGCRDVSSSLERGNQILEKGEESSENLELRLPGTVIGGKKIEDSITRKKVMLIEEEQEHEKTAINAKNTTKSSSVLPLPQIEHSVVRFEGKPKATSAVVTLHLPPTHPSPTSTNSSRNSKSTLDNSIQITSKIDSVNVTLPGYAPVHVQLPLAVHADKATAVVSLLPQNKKVLTLTLPFASFDEVTKWTER